MLLMTEKKKKNPSISIYAGCINLFNALYVPTKKPSRSLIHSVSDTQMQLAICKIAESVKNLKRISTEDWV